MNLLKLILKEHSKANTSKIVAYVGSDPTHFATLVTIFLQGPDLVTQRAAWPISYCVQHHPELIKRHLKKIVDFADQPGVHDAAKRSVIRSLQFVAIPKNMQGKVFDFCYRCLANRKESIAIRVFSMTVLSNLAKENPELKNEIIPLIEDQLPFASAGFRSRGSRVLNELASSNCKIYQPLM
ncbi:MAG: hypothetical protein ORN54_14775 [Cyclobacteriaceae bacterium]|nr:hypothetical protein [Cyclobacteriaceae bacterium]